MNMKIIILLKTMGFKENLKEQLNFSGIYVKELAAISGVKKQTIDSYLNTQSCIPAADAAVAIAQALGVSVEYLVTGKENKAKTARYPKDVQIAVEILTEMNEKNRKMALAIIKTMKKQEEEGKKAGT